MYRMELKEHCEEIQKRLALDLFLMHRVELRVSKEVFSLQAVLSQLRRMQTVGGGKRFKLLNTV